MVGVDYVKLVQFAISDWKGCERRGSQGTQSSEASMS